MTLLTLFCQKAAASFSFAESGWIQSSPRPARTSVSEYHNFLLMHLFTVPLVGNVFADISTCFRNSFEQWLSKVPSRYDCFLSRGVTTVLVVWNWESLGNFDPNRFRRKRERINEEEYTDQLFYSCSFLWMRTHPNSSSFSAGGKTDLPAIKHSFVDLN